MDAATLVELVNQRLDTMAAGLKRLEDKLDSGQLLSRDVYEARHEALKARVDVLEESKRWLIRAIAAEGLAVGGAAFAWAAQAMGG